MADLGADLDARDRWGRTALAWAAYNGHTGAVRILLGAGATLREKWEGGRRKPSALRQRMFGNRWSTALHLATDAVVSGRGGEGGREVLALLLARRGELGIDVNACDAEGRTALHDAVAGGSAWAARQLLGAGADVYARDGEGRTPLEHGVRAGCTDAEVLDLADEAHQAARPSGDGGGGDRSAAPPPHLAGEGEGPGSVDGGGAAGGTAER